MPCRGVCRKYVCTIMYDLYMVCKYIIMCDCQDTPICVYQSLSSQVSVCICVCVCVCALYVIISCCMCVLYDNFQLQMSIIITVIVFYNFCCFGSKEASKKESN